MIGRSFAEYFPVHVVCFWDLCLYGLPVLFLDLMFKSTSDKILDEMLRHMSNVALLMKGSNDSARWIQCQRYKKGDEVIKLEAHCQIHN